MNLKIPTFKNVVSKLLSYAKRSGTTNPSQWLIDWVNGGPATSSGLNVNEDTALKYTPFWAAVRIITGTISSLPFIVYRRDAEGNKTRAINHPAYRLLHNRPNQYMDALTFIETRQAHVLTYGNGYAEIQRDGGGRPIALWPLLPDRTARKITDEGVPYYEVRPSTGGTVTLPDYNVLHIKGLGFDGYTGYNVVHYHKEAIGYGMAAKEYSSSFFGNGAEPNGILTHPETLSKEARKNLKESWQKDQGGLSNAHRMQVLEEGMTWKQTTVDPEKSQTLDTQKFTVDDCARIFNIPPHKIASLQFATFSNIEEQNIDFVTSTMLYWFRSWEQECNYKLFSPSEQSNMFCEILAEGLLRGDTDSRAASYATGRQWGYLSINDIRRLENMNSIGPEGDIYLDPLNMKPAGSETPLLDSSNNTDDDTRQAHRSLIASQWSRVILKQNNAAQKKVSKEFYVKQRSYALKIMFGPVNAYASICGVSESQVRVFLKKMIEKKINEATKIEINEADILADDIMKKIGDNHG